MTDLAPIICKMLDHLDDMKEDIREDSIAILAFDCCAFPEDFDDDLEKVDGWMNRLLKIKADNSVDALKILLQEMLSSNLLDEAELNPEDEYTLYVAGRRVLRLARSLLEGLDDSSS